MPWIIAKGTPVPVTAHTSRMSIVRSLNCDGKYGLGLVIAAMLLLLPLLGGEALKLAWRYERAAIGDLAPTILTLLGVPVPPTYDGRVLKIAAPQPGKGE